MFAVEKHALTVGNVYIWAKPVFSPKRGQGTGEREWGWLLLVEYGFRGLNPRKNA